MVERLEAAKDLLVEAKEHDRNGGDPKQVIMTQSAIREVRGGRRGGRKGARRKGAGKGNGWS